MQQLQQQQAVPPQVVEAPGAMRMFAVPVAVAPTCEFVRSIEFPPFCEY
jgi:hypothetical protein